MIHYLMNAKLGAKMKHYYQTGDLVVMIGRKYKINIKGSIGIVRSVHGDLVNVSLPEGTWAFPKWELKPLTKEESCTR